MFFKIAFLFGLAFIGMNQAATMNTNLPEQHGDKFFYFAYGSNMLTKRIHIQNPSAIKVGGALLKEYRLDFNTYSPRWHGAPATVVPNEGTNVYGTLWEIGMENLKDLDEQEGVPEKHYKAVSVQVELGNELVYARAYILVDQPEEPLSNLTSIPEGRRPSKTYLQCLIKGAIETGIPQSYVDWLRTIKHNGRVASDMEGYLELEDIELSE